MSVVDITPELESSAIKYGSQYRTGKAGISFFATPISRNRRTMCRVNSGLSKPLIPFGKHVSCKIELWSIFTSAFTQAFTLGYPHPKVDYNRNSHRYLESGRRSRTRQRISRCPLDHHCRSNQMVQSNWYLQVGNFRWSQ